VTDTDSNAVAWPLEPVGVIAAAPRHRRRLLPGKRSAVRQLTLACADLGAIICAALVVYALVDSHRAFLVMLASWPIWLMIAKAHDLYDADEGKAWHLTTDEAPRLFYFVTLSVAICWMIMSFVGVSALGAQAALSVWIVALSACAMFRTLTRAAWRRFVPAERTVVVGDGPAAMRITRKLQLERGHHMEVVARVPLTKDLERRELRRVVADTYAHRIIVAAQDLDSESHSDISLVCREEGLKLCVVAPQGSVLRSAAHIYNVAELSMIELPTAGPSPVSLSAKRAFDVVVSGFALVLGAPLFLLIAVAVRRDSPGGALFRQTRAGAAGKPFTMLKFRSMCVDAEDRLSTLVDVDALSDPMFKFRADPRVTRVGRILRATSLDELPQLWNVLRGDMSLVGPRPEELRVVEHYDAEARLIRLAMRPGVTGPMQVHGRGELTFSERLDVERDYVEHYRLSKDFGILMRTVGVVVFRQGAY